jgi:prepilin-type N-terminal cleavage/methylation domain-containing protein
MFTLQRRSRSTSGFTLIELVIVLVLFGILVALAAPNLAGYIRTTKVDGALNELSGDVAYTRMLAVRSGQRAKLTILSGGTSYIIEVNEPSTAWRVAKQVNLATDYRSVTLSPAQTPLAFNSRGLLLPPPSQPTSQSVSIVAQYGSSNAVLKVLQTGRAYRDY